MRHVLLFILTAGLSLNAFAGSVYVRGSVRNGHYVAPHYRSSPDQSFYNNWSAKGNVNPYTGKSGTITYQPFSKGSLAGYGITPASSASGLGYLANLRTAASKGDSAAQNNLGVLYYNGDGVKQSYSEAAKWYRKAIEKGDPCAEHNLGLMYANGTGVEKDVLTSLHLLSLSAQHGHTNSIRRFELISHRIPQWALIQIEQFTSFPDMKGKASNGNAIAQYWLGEFYSQGIQVERDFRKAEKWFQKSALQDSSDAETALGELYLGGKGVNRDYATALKWLNQAAEKENAAALCDLGDIYANGWGVKTNFELSVEFYRKSAEKGNAAAQCCLGHAYLDGSGVTKDCSEGISWYLKAADQGYLDAYTSLGYCYSTGEGVTKDFQQAVMWTKKAAEMGESLAQSNYGEFFRDGDGVPQDYVEAYKWFNLAASQGDKEAGEFRTKLSAKMTQEQIAEGQKRSSAFVKKAYDESLFE